MQQEFDGFLSLITQVAYPIVVDIFPIWIKSTRTVISYAV